MIRPRQNLASLSAGRGRALGGTLVALLALGPSTALGGSAPPGALHGEKAIAHLKQEGAYDALVAAMTRARYAINRVEPTPMSNAEGAYEALNPAVDLRTSFTATGIRVRSSGERQWQLGLELKSYGYGENLLGLTSGETTVRDDRIEIRKHAVRSPESWALVEWYVNTPQGLEQGFTLPAPPERAAIRPAAGPASVGWLRLTLASSGDVRGESSADGQAVRFKDGRGREVARYDHLAAWDATGRALASRMVVDRREVALEVDDRDAQYPIVVDPLVWQEVSAPSGEPAAFDEAGYAVGISGDTAIIGCFHDQFSHQAGFDTPGKVFIFVRKHTSWTEPPQWEHQATLEGTTATAQYGSAVAISGNTAIVGDPVGSFDFNAYARGAVYIFVRTENGWTLRKRIEASDPSSGSRFGHSVAINGETAVVGAPHYGPFVSTLRQGKAYVFASQGGSWNEEKQLAADDGVTEDQFGVSVAVSGDTVVVGAPFHDVVTGAETTSEDQGQAYVFVREAGGWSAPTRLAGSIGAPFDHFGYSVGISRGTAIIGAYGSDLDTGVGVAYIFGRSGSGWNEQQILAADDGQVGNDFGFSVAITGDTAVIGAPLTDISIGLVSRDRQGAAYVFHRDGPLWKQTDKLIASDGAAGDVLGYSVAVGGVGVIAGAPGDDVAGLLNQGSASIFQQLDSDGDGLPDEWEKKGVTIEGSFIDLPKMGADPLHKDIFVHADWMATGPNGAVLKPSARAIKMVTDAFAASPVTNPDGKKGVRLHVDVGPNSIMNPRTGAKWGPLSRAGQVPFQETLGAFGDAPGFLYNWGDFDEIKEATFDAFHRGSVFHYVLSCNALPPDLLVTRPIRGNARSDPGADFLIALGAYRKPDGSVRSATPLEQALTFMHELGHNLGLDHGGTEELQRKVNFKPNYLSIMNYRFDSTGLLSGSKKQRKLDYSRSPLSTLNERNLNEAIGISDPAGHLTTWNSLTGFTAHVTSPNDFNKCLINGNGFWKIFLPGPALDWNCDGLLTPVTDPVIEDINSDGRCISHGRDANEQDLPLETVEAYLVGDDEIRAEYVTSGPDRICQTPKHGINDIPLQQPGFVQPDTLTGFNDWPALIFDGGARIGALLGGDDVDPVDTPLGESATERVQEDVPAALLAEDEAAPLDDVTYAPQEGPAALTVDFDGSASTAVTGTIVDWAWDFGDGATGTGALVTHTYVTPGEYFASLTVTDDSGRVNLVPLLNLVTVTDPPPATPTPTTTPTRTPTPATTPSRTATPTPNTGGTGPTPTPHPTPVGAAGDVDLGFDATVTGVNARPVDAVVTQPDGKIIVGGDFESFAGCARRNVARINPDGSCDPSFDPGLVLTAVYHAFQNPDNIFRTGFPVQALALQADGKILVGVATTPGLQHGAPTSNEMIVRLNPDGTLDSSFDGPDSFFVTQNHGRAYSGLLAIAVQTNGKILIGGTFTSTATTSVRRLNADGSMDASFNAPNVPYLGPNAYDVVRALALQPDGKVVIGGSFTSTGIPRHGVARLDADGNLDAGYNSVSQATGLAFGSTVYELVVQTDGKVLAAGSLTGGGGAGLVRLNADGSRDTEFTNWTSSAVYGLALQTDQTILVGGDFQITVPAARNGIARLGADGALDPTFDTPGVNVPGGISAIALHANGKIVAVGIFDHFDGASAEGIVQLAPDGGRDPSFDSNGAGLHSRVFALVRQPDGKLLVGFISSSANKSSHLNGARRGGIGRLNADGTTDLTFTSPFDPDSFVSGIALQSDGKVIIGGTFRLLGSSAALQPEITFARLNPDGTLDTGFVLPADVTFVGGFAVQADDKIVTNEVSRFGSRRLVRLNPNGSLDDPFSFPLSGGLVGDIVVQPDGKILIAGLFLGIDPNQYARVGRLNADGSLDATFDPGSGPDNEVRVLVLQPDGKVLIAGWFLSYDGTARNRLARLDADGSLDPSFVPSTPYTGFTQRVGALALQPDGKVVVGIEYNGAISGPPNRIVRLNPGGGLDASFPQDGTGIEGTTANVNAMLLQPDGGLVFGGEFAVVDGVARLALARLLGPTLPATLDHFLFYKVKSSKGASKLAPLGPVTLADALATTDVDVHKVVALGVPADVNGAGVSDTVTHLSDYLLKVRKGGPKFQPLTDMRVQNPCSDLVVTVQKPERLLMPTHLDVLDPPPDAKTHEVADFRCYQVKVQKKRADGTPLAPFPKSVQLDAGDRFQSRRYELKKLTRLCYPVAESGAPVVLKTGVPIPFTPAALRHETVHLACYQAKPAKKRIEQDGCGPLDPKDKGTKIVPAPPKHQKHMGLQIRSQLGPGTLDTAKEIEFCIPSTVSPR